MAQATTVSVDLNGDTFTLYDDFQFYDAGGNPTGVYATADHRITDAAGTADYGTWDDNGTVTVGGMSGTWNNSTAGGGGTGYTQIGTITAGGVEYQIISDGSETFQFWSNGAQVGYGTFDPNTGNYNIYSKTDGKLCCTVNIENGTIIGSDGKPYGTAEVKIPIENIGTPYTVNGKTYYLLPGDSQLYDAEENPTGYYIQNGQITAGDNTPIPGFSLNGNIATYTPYKGSLTITNPNGTTTTLYMTNDNQIVDDQGNPIYTYSQTGDYGYDIFDPKTGKKVGTYDSRTGIYADISGAETPIGFKPTGVNIPPYGDVTTTITGSTTGTTTNQTGIDWNSPVASALLPAITEGALNLPGLAKTAGTQAQEGYLNLMNQAMSPQNFQGYLNALAKKGVLNSSLTGSTLSNAQQQAAQAIANKSFDASLANTLAQMKIPGYLGSLTSQLGGTLGTSTSINNQTGNKTVTDPLRPFGAYFNFLNLA